MSKPGNSGLNPAELRFLYLSPASRQALMGMRAVALEKRNILAADAARRAGLPGNALAKIFQRLARFGLLRSQRGPGGGYSLARSPRDITLADILRAVQDIIPGGRHCLLGHKLCGDGSFCLIHEVITEADDLVINGLRRLTLADLARSEGWNKETRK